MRGPEVKYKLTTWFDHTTIFVLSRKVSYHDKSFKLQEPMVEKIEFGSLMPYFFPKISALQLDKHVIFFYISDNHL